MTENQLFPMSADLFDTSSNSNNPLKYDLYSFGFSNNSNSSIGLFGSNTLHTLSPPPPQAIPATSSPSSPPTTNTPTYQSPGSNGLSNLMLTNAITIPRSNNPNQSHHSSYLDDTITRYHPSPSPQNHHHPHQHPHHMMAAHHQQQQRLMADLSDYGLDALDTSSLSPTLLQDVSLSAASPLNSSSQHSITPNGNASTGFYTNDASPVSNSADSSIVGSANNVESVQSVSDVLTLNAAGGNNGDDANNTLIYEVTPNSNSMWSDIGSAIITTKNEPFNIEDDYIFPNDKSDIQASGFTDLNDANLLEVIGNIDDFLPTTTASNTGYLLSPQSTSSLQQLTSPEVSPSGPPMQLLQQQLQQQHAHSPNEGGGGLLQQTSHNSPRHNQQQLHQSSGGAMHHTHHHHSSSSPYEIYHSTPNKPQMSNSASTTFSPGSQSSHSPLLINSITPPPPPHANRSQYQQNVVKSRNMQEMLKKEFSMSPDRSSTTLLGQSVPGSHIILSGSALSPSSGSSGFGSATGGSVRKSFSYQNDVSVSRLSSSAPTHLGIETIWMRREPRQHLLSTGSLAEAESFSSISTGSVLSPDGIDFSQDDDDDGSSDYNSDHYDDFSSDGSDNEDDHRTSTPSQLSSSKGKERYFWQYNVQAKGPKGKRLVFQSKLEDPHVLNEVTDPVFSPNCSVRGIKHSGKARKGDGNDLTPNPRKLHSIGKELDKLSRTINDMTPVSELPFNVRPKSRKEKNKLASRACRLKKKAQHEANKIKLFGLEIEHRRLLTGIAEIKQALAIKYHNRNVGESTDEVDQQIEMMYKTAITGIRIAGGTTDFVNKVLDKIKSGVPNGGLEELKSP